MIFLSMRVRDFGNIGLISSPIMHEDEKSWNTRGAKLAMRKTGAASPAEPGGLR
jgi:hypothetical protein